MPFYAYAVIMVNEINSRYSERSRKRERHSTAKPPHPLCVTCFKLMQTLNYSANPLTPAAPLYRVTLSTGENIE